MAKSKPLWAVVIFTFLLGCYPEFAFGVVRMKEGILLRLWEDRTLPAATDQLESMRLFCDANRALLGLADTPEVNLILTETRSTAIGQRYVFEQHAYGLPVFDAQLIVVAEGGMLKSLFNALSSARFDPPEPAISTQSALVAAQNAASAANLRASAEVKLGYVASSKLIYRAFLPAQNPSADWEVWVDAQSGQILRQVDRRVFEDGIGQIFDPDPQTAIQSDTLQDENDSNAAIPIEAYSVDTLFGLDPPSGGYFYLQGPWVYTLQPTGRAREITPNFIYWRQDDRFEEVMVYRHIDYTQRYFQNQLQTPNANDRQQVCMVNGTEEDNSWYSPFSREITYGYGGVDDAEDADVIIHEYGHAVQDDINRFWNGGQTGAMGEGFGDYLAGAYSLSVDTVFQPNWVFNWDGHNEFWPGRVLNAPYHYPENAWGEIHDAGQLWSAGLLDVWWDISDRIAWERIVLQHHFLLGNGALMPDAAEAILTVELNLYGGLYRQVIVDNFADRGFVSSASYYPRLLHDPLPDTEDTLATEFEVIAQITSQVPLDPAALNVYWRADQGSFIPQNLTATGSPDEFHAFIPGPFNGQLISYYLTAADTLGMGTFLPEGAPTETFQFYVGPDTIPPQVLWVDSLGQTYLINATFPVLACVIDNLGIGTVELLWHMEGGEEQIALMEQVAADTFQGQITYANQSLGQTVYYRIRAVDSSSQQNVTLSEESLLGIMTTAALDDFEGPTGSWLFTGDWGLTSQFSHSSSHSIEDSPGASYPPNSNTWAQWDVPLFLSDFVRARLIFWERHFFEADHDFGYFEVSADNGPWQSLMEITGVSTGWAMQEVPLDSFCSGAAEDLRFRFRVSTDDQQNALGWFIDDLAISVEINVPTLSEAPAKPLPQAFALEPIYPNPFNLGATIKFDLPIRSNLLLNVYNLRGEVVAVLAQGQFEAGSHRIRFDGTGLSSGLYFCRIQAGSYVKLQKLVLAK